MSAVRGLARLVTTRAARGAQATGTLGAALATAATLAVMAAPPAMTALTVTTAITATGCGDGPICSERILVGFANTIDGQQIAGDADPDLAGIQRDIAVQSPSLRAGDSYELVVTDAAGGVAAFTATAGDDGGAVFTGVTLPEGAVVLSLTGTSAQCGSATAEITVNVGGSGCALAIRQEPLENEFYAPLRVLNTTNDGDPALPDFQADIDVTTSAGFAVELIALDIQAGQEQVAGQAQADDAGAATFAVTLGQGRQAVRAVCSSADGTVSTTSPTTLVFVDTLVPFCTLDDPPPGTFVIPDLDVDAGTPGTQIVLTGTADPGPGGDPGGDVEGEVVQFAVDGASVAGTAIDANGQSTAVVTLATPGTFSLAFATQDHAGNPCGDSHDHDYVEEGCAFTVATDLDQIFTTDANGDPNDGFQVDIALDVDPACEGDLVLTDCGDGDTQANVPAGGQTTVQVTMCQTADCELTEQCTVSTRSEAGIVVQQDVVVSADNVAPTVALQFISPPLACGGAVTPAADVDAGAPGVQLDVRVVSPGFDEAGVDVTDAGMATATFAADAGGDTRITVQPGISDVSAFAEDAANNRGLAAPCAVTLADIAVNFAPPIDDGLVGGNDGLVGLGDLTLDLCGTVSELGLTVDVAIDGGPPQPATVIGTDWCLSAQTLAESPPAHAIDVVATDGVRFGFGSLSLTVDVTGPGTVNDLAGTAPTRQSARLTWTAPSDGGSPAASYVLKVATSVLGEANFDTTGTAVAAPVPAAPGTGQSALVEQLDAGTDYFFALAALDPAGNRSLVAAFGPIRPEFDQTGALLPVAPADGDNALGYQMAHGDFNGDGLSDVAIAAPFKSVGVLGGAGTVYVYFGRATGLPGLPDVTIEGSAAGGQLGNGLAALSWGGDAADDLAVGAPFDDGFSGRVYVFTDVDGLGAVASDANADVVIGSNGGFFAGSALGWAVASADFDGDGADDLVMSAPGGGGFAGGLAVLFGGTAETQILLSELDNSGSGTAVALVLTDPDAGDPNIFGQALFDLGRTEGAGDARDDIGVAYDQSNTAYVYRGRAQPAGPGTAVAAFDPALDLELVNATADTSTRFGNAMGSIADLDGDGARDVAVGAWQQGSNQGRVFLVSGGAVGTQSIPETGFNGFLITRIIEGTGVRRLGTAIANNALAGIAPDINDDGLEDLVIVGRFSVDPANPPHQVQAFVWYGGRIPLGQTVSTNAANHRITAPATFNADLISSVSTPNQVMWAGDVNGDGLEDICWADSVGNGRDGSFELLSDDGI